MQCFRKIGSDRFWVGGNDRRLALFENVYPIPRGVSYNAYLVADERTVLLDTVDQAVAGQFFENLDAALAGRSLDDVVINHMEPDHAATLGELVRRYPQVRVICNERARNMIGQFFPAGCEGGCVGLGGDDRFLIMKDGDTYSSGRHTFTFIFAPMVHWPEVMVTYDTAEKVLYSADAFGTFGALGGNLYADEMDFPGQWLADARRYYTNIVGKYGPQVQNLLKKAAAIEIGEICPLHGPIWRKNIAWFVEKYDHWSRYEPEDREVLVVYGSIYGHTASAAERLAAELAESGLRNVAVHDVSVTHPSELVAEAFRCSHLVLASVTYNGGLFTPMEIFLRELAAHNLQNRVVAMIQNGSWAPMAVRHMNAILEPLKNTKILEPVVTIRSSAGPDQLAEIAQLARAIAESVGVKG